MPWGLGTIRAGKNWGKLGKMGTIKSGGENWGGCHFLRYGNLLSEKASHSMAHFGIRETLVSHNYDLSAPSDTGSDSKLLLW